MNNKRLYLSSDISVDNVGSVWWYICCAHIHRGTHPQRRPNNKYNQRNMLFCLFLVLIGMQFGGKYRRHEINNNKILINDSQLIAVHCYIFPILVILVFVNCQFLSMVNSICNNRSCSTICMFFFFFIRLSNGWQM